jgi:hypothetical protein
MDQDLREIIQGMTAEERRIFLKKIREAVIELEQMDFRAYYEEAISRQLSWPFFSDTPPPPAPPCFWN